LIYEVSNNYVWHNFVSFYVKKLPDELLQTMIRYVADRDLIFENQCKLSIALQAPLSALVFTLSATRAITSIGFK